MLTCPICNQPVSEREMQEGRCPECMGLMSWQGFQTDSSMELFPGKSESDSKSDLSAVPPESGGDEQSLDLESGIDLSIGTGEAGGDPPSAIDQTQPPQEPLTGYPKPLLDISASLLDTNQELNEGEPPGAAGLHSLQLQQTLQSQLQKHLAESSDIAQSIIPRQLSLAELEQINSDWASKADLSHDIHASLDPKSTPPGSKSSLVVKPRSVSGVHESHGEGNDYEMMEALGQGGVGVVYSARQASIDRTVALKVLRPELAQNPDYRNKFLAEAVVIGDLDHPQIVPIYDLGKNSRDELFYTMKRVEGTPWSKKIDTASLEENLEILIKICDAIAFAHHRGVIHRDLKPDNVMLGDFGEVLVMDWGLAIVTEQSSKHATIEDSGGLGGTPAYMAPEMVTGPIQKIDHRSDIYLLGAQLFRILTGKTPHHGKNVKECVKAAAQNLLQPTEMRGELIDIALKAMATRPEDRFRTAVEFRDALKSYEAHAESLKLSLKAEKDLKQAKEQKDYQLFARSVFGFEEAIALWRENSSARTGQIRAREEYAKSALTNGDFDLGLSVLDRKEASHLPLVKKLEAEQQERDSRKRQLERSKQIFRWATLGFVLMLSVACVMIYLKMMEADRQKQLAEEASKGLKTANGNLDISFKELAKEKENSDKARDAAKTAQGRAEESEKIAKENQQLAEQNRKLAEAQTYVAQIALAAKMIEENRFDEARETLRAYLGSPLVGWEWGRLWDLCSLALADRKLAAPLQDVTCSVEGDRFAVAGDDGFVRVWNSADFRAQKPPLWEDRPRAGAESPITSVEFSPDTTILAAGDRAGVVSLLKITENAIERWRELPIPWFSEAPISSLRFSFGNNPTDPSDRTRWLLVGSETGEAAVWDLDREAWLQFPRGTTLRGHRREVQDIAASPDRRYLLTAGQDDKIQIWFNPQRGAPRPVSTAGTAQVDEPYEIWKTVYWMHAGAVLCLDTIVDSRGQLLIASGGEDGSVYLWNLDDVPSDNLTSVPPRITIQEPRSNSAIRDVRWFRRNSGERELSLLACGDARTVQLWTVNPELLTVDRAAANSVSDADRPASAATLQHEFRGHGSRVTACDPVHVARDGAQPLIVSVGEDQRVMLWDPASYSEQQLFELETESQILGATFDHDSDRIATVSSKGVLSLTDLASNRSTQAVERELPAVTGKEGHDYLANRGRFLPSAAGEPERWFVSAGIDGKVIVWDLERGVSIHEYPESGRTSIIAIAPDRRRIVTGGAGLKALLSDLPAAITNASAEPTSTTTYDLVGHNDVVTAVCFSSDGRWIVTGDKLGELRLWPNAQELVDSDAVESVASTRAHSEEVTGLHALGDTIVTTSRDYSVKVWTIGENAETGEFGLTMVRRLRGTGEVTESTIDSQRGFLACVRRQYSQPEGETESQKLMMTSEITVYGMNGETPEEWTLSKPDQVILAADFFPNENWLVLTESSGKAWIWDWTTGAEYPLPFNAATENYCTRVDGTGSRLVTTGGRQIRIWNFDRRRKQISSMSTALESERLLGPHYRISCVSFSVDDAWIVTGDLNGYVKLWQQVAGKGGYQLEYRVPVRTGSAIVATRFSPRDPRTLLTTWEDQLIQWSFDGQQWVEEKRISVEVESGFSYVDYSPSGSKLLVGRQDGTCELWNADDLTREVVLPAQPGYQHQQSILCGAFSADERLIATGSDDKNARGLLWQLDTGTWKPVAKIAGHSGGITSVAFSPIDHQRLLTGSRDGTAKLWDISQWSASGTRRSSGSSIEELLTLRGHEREITAVAFDHTGQYLLTASRDGKSIRWKSAPIDPSVVVRQNSLDVLPGQRVPLGLEFDIRDPVAPELSGGMLRLTLAPLSGSNESQPVPEGATLELEAGAASLERPDADQRTVVSLTAADGSRVTLGTVVAGARGGTTLGFPFELQIEPGATPLRLVEFLSQLHGMFPIPDAQSGPLELVVTLTLELPHNVSSPGRSAQLTLRILPPEPEPETVPTDSAAESKE